MPIMDEFTGDVGVDDVYYDTEDEMCQHSSFEVIYYRRGIMFRRCQDCGQIEMHADWNWTDIEEIKRALGEVGTRDAQTR